MASGKGKIGLKIAERSKPTAESFDTRSKAVEAWVADLPLGNIGALSKLVYHALSEVNRLAINGKDFYVFYIFCHQLVTKYWKHL